MRQILLLCLLWIPFFGMSLPSNPTSITSKDSVSEYISEARAAVYNDFPKALKLLKKADSLAGLEENRDYLPEVDHAYGVAYYVKGDYDKSLQYFLEAMDAFRKEENQQGIAKGLIGQGLIQQGIDRHPEAIRLFEEAIEAYNKAGEPAAANPAYVNIAISEIERENFSAAKENLERAIELARAAERPGIIHLAHNKLGEISYKEGDFDTALEHYSSVLNDREEPNGWEKSFANAGLAQTYLALGNIELAEVHGLQAIEFAKKAHSLWDLERNTKILSEIYAEKGAMDSAFGYLQENQKYKDSLYNQEKLQEVNLLQLENQEAENLRLQAEKENAEKQLFINRIITFLLVLVSLFLILLVVLFRKNTKQKEKFNRELEEKNRTILEKNEVISKRNRELDEIDKAKNRLFSILSHDLKSPIGSIQQLLEMMKSGEFTNEERASLVDEMLKQISGTSFMLHNLLYWAGSQLEGNKIRMENVALPPEVEKVLEAYYWPAKQKNISVVHKPSETLPEIRVDNAQLSVILHNLISNAIKFTREERNIEISYTVLEEKVQLRIKDGGVGISPEKIEEIKNFSTPMLSQLGTDMETGTGLGLLLVKDFLNSNNAELEIRSIPNEGSEFIVSFLKAS